jgi:hypothetical protein
MQTLTDNIVNIPLTDLRIQNVIQQARFFAMSVGFHVFS